MLYVIFDLYRRALLFSPSTLLTQTCPDSAAREVLEMSDREECCSNPDSQEESGGSVSLSTADAAGGKQSQSLYCECGLIKNKTVEKRVCSVVN